MPLSFNGATVFQPWRHSNLVVKGMTQWIDVSMEPRFFNHGDSRPPLMASPMTSCFNGATVFQPWRQAMMAERYEEVKPGVVSMEPRFFNHGDGRHQHRCHCEIVNVSMEPRFFNHGDPPRFPRGSSWALIGDFECLLCPGQKLFNSSATRRDARRVAVRLYFEHLPAFWRVLRCSKLPASDK